MTRIRCRRIRFVIPSGMLCGAIGVGMMAACALTSFTATSFAAPLEIGDPPPAPDIGPPPPLAAPVIPVVQDTTGAADGQSAEGSIGLIAPDGTDLTSPDVPVPAAEDPAKSASHVVHRPDEELLLLEMSLGDELLADAMAGFINGSSLLLPLRDVADVLEFPIGVDAAAGTASGWFIKENRLFYLNVLRNTVVVEGRESAIPPGMVELHPDDIFIDIRMLSTWFPLDIHFDISNMTVGLTSREPLAIEMRLARDEYRKRVFSRRKAGTELPQANAPYKLADWPILNLDIRNQVNKQREQEAAFSTDYNLLATADLGYMNAELFTAGDNKDKVTETRLKFERKDPGGRILGEGFGDTPVTSFAVGDIYSPEIPLVANTQLGRGVMVSSLPLNTPTEFDKITLDGDLPLGWEVELYRNEVLIDFQVSSEDGRYNFTNVPLLFGVNVLKLVFFGPQGQTREEIKQFRVGDTQVKPGEVQFRMAANQHDKRLLYKQRTTIDDREGDARVFGEAQVGLTQNLSVGTTVSMVPDDQGQQRFVGLSTSTTLGNIYTRGEFTKQQGGGYAGRLSGQTSVLGISVIGQHDRYFSGYFSEYTPDTGDPLTSVTKLRLDGAIPESAIPRIPFGITVDHSRRASKATETRMTARTSQAVGPASITNSLTGSYNKASDGSIDKTASGIFLIGGRIDGLRMRGQVGYDVAPTKGLSSMALSGDWRISETYMGNASVTHSMGETTSTAYSLGMNAAFEAVSLGMALDYTNSEEIIGKMTLNFSLARDPNSKTLEIARGNIATKGAMAARVFLDHDANGVFSDGDEPLSGIGFLSDRTPLKGRTNDEGYAYVNGLEPYREVDLKVDVATLGDPYWIAHPGGVRIVPRPGTTASLDFPIVSTGEIDGTVFRVWRDGPGSVSGVIVQLVDANGDVAREQESAYDGFFLFDFVAPGTYTLRVSPEQMAALGLEVDNTYEVVIDGGGTIVSGQDFVLK